jgi:hypothetical protein
MRELQTQVDFDSLLLQEVKEISPIVMGFSRQRNFHLIYYLKIPVKSISLSTEEMYGLEENTEIERVPIIVGPAVNVKD